MTINQNSRANFDRIDMLIKTLNTLWIHANFSDESKKH